MNNLATQVAPHLPVLFGLMIGTLARYGLELDKGETILPRKVLGHLMMLGLLGLIAEIAADAAKAAPAWRALLGAAAALLGAKLVARYQRFAEQQADRRLPVDPPLPGGPA